MFEGKMLRELAGIPIRRIDLANSELALAEPDPLTLANLTTKSLTLWIAALRGFDFVAIGSELVKGGHFVCPPLAFARGRLWVLAFAGTTSGVIGCGMPARPGLCRAGICACPRRRSG